MSWIVEKRTVGETRIVAIRRRVTFGEDSLGEIIEPLYDQLYAALPSDAAEREGQNVIAYLPVGERTADMFVGRHWDGEAPGDLEILHLPAGETAHTRHRGCYGELPAAHQAVCAWLRQRDQTRVGWNWEIYGDWSEEPSDRVTDVFYLLLDV